MGKAKGAAIAFGIAAGIIGIFGAYVMYQESAERDYLNEVNGISSDLNKITTELNNIGLDVSANKISITQAKFSLSSLVNDAERLHQHSSSINVPDKYRSAHLHLIQGLDYYTRAMLSTKNAFEYTEKALQTSQNLQTSLFASIIGAIFGVGSLPSLSGMADLYSNTEAAKAAYNDAIRYSAQAEDELKIFYSLTQINIQQPIPFRLTVSAESTSEQRPTQGLLDECKNLGIPEFTCTEQQVMAKKRLVAAQQSGAYGSGAKNFSFTITNTGSGLAFISVGTSGKKTIATGYNSPTLEVNMGDTVTIHIENLDSTEKHDFAISDLNVHSKMLGYFEADSVTFKADNAGQFTYTSTSHPETKGLLVVQ